MPTDHHVAVRDAVKTVLATAYPTLSVHALDDIEELRTKSMPCIVVACVGPEQERPEMSTNGRDGRMYPVAVVIVGAGLPDGEQSTTLPEMTAFRRQVYASFHNKRLSGVSEVGWCEVFGDSRVYNDNLPNFQMLSTELVVGAVGRWPRS